MPVVARAQQASIGFLIVARRERTHAVAAFQGSLKETGYGDDHNVTIEYRWANDQYDRLPNLAADFVTRKPSLIVAGGGSLSALDAKRATSTIPIVIAIGADPVRMGLLASLNRPGGNVTGVTFLLNALVAKRLELLRELVPTARLIGVIADAVNPNAQNDLRETEDAATALGLHIFAAKARSEADIEAAFETLSHKGQTH